MVSPCSLCATSDSEIVSTKDRHGKVLETRVCMGCGQVFNYPVPSDDELTRFYAEDYRKSYKGAARPRGRQIIRNFRRVSRHLKRFADVFEGRERILDVGAGSGEFVFSLTQMGKSVTGLEPNRDYAAYCREELNINVQTNQIDTFEPHPDGYDFIQLSHVLEHLNDPVRYLVRLGGWLAPGGVLYVEVPDIVLFAANKSKGNLFHYGHIFNFSPWTLRSAARLAGLVEWEKTSHRSVDKTHVFFMRSDTRATSGECLNPANASVVQNAIVAHYRGEAGKTGPVRAALPVRLMKKLSVLVNETVSARRMADPRAIGLSVLREADVI